MSKKPIDTLIDHDFDGIREYDNPLPPWWVYLFVITIVWAVLYFFYYDITGMGNSSAKEYENEIASFNKQKSATPALAEMVLTNDDLTKKNNEQILILGKQVFLKNCVSCHGQNGEGGIGPNLTDDYWIHGGRFQDVITTIFNGVLEKSMPAWKNLLSKDELIAVANYVYSINGSNPPNPKAPQGNLFKREN